MRQNKVPVNCNLVQSASQYHIPCYHNTVPTNRSQSQQPVSQYQYVSVPIPTTPQVTRPLLREKVHDRQHGDTLILPKLMKAIGNRARYTGKVQLTQKSEQEYRTLATSPPTGPFESLTCAWQLITQLHTKCFRLIQRLPLRPLG